MDLLVLAAVEEVALDGRTGMQGNVTKTAGWSQRALHAAQGHEPSRQERRRGPDSVQRFLQPLVSFSYATICIAGCPVERFWSLLSARLPLGGIPTLTPALKQLVWQALLARPLEVQACLPAHEDDEG